MTAMDHGYAEAHGVVKAYLGDRLGDSERDAFEAHYFACATCMAQLEAESDFREGMLDVAAQEAARAAADHARLGLLAGLARLSRARRLALGGALLLALAVPFALLLTANGDLRRELLAERTARVATPTPQTLQTPQNAGGDRRLGVERPGDTRQARAGAGGEAAEAGGPQVNLPLFTLAAVRGGEEAGREPVNRLPLLATTPSAVLDLELGAVDFPSYGAVLRDESGRAIWQARGLHPDGRDSLVLLFPTRMLPAGVYRLAIDGVKADGRETAVAVYPFRVVRP